MNKKLVTWPTSAHIYQLLMLFLFIMTPLADLDAKIPTPPNGEQFVEGEADDAFNQRIIKTLQNFNLNLESSDLKKIQLTWPLNDTERHILSAFESPDVVRVNFEIPGSNGQMQPQRFWSVIPHKALDVCRSNTSLSADLHAPVSGLAFAIQEEVAGLTPTTYSTAIAIYHSESHTVTVLLHARPRADLTLAQAPVNVKQGERIGELSNEVPSLPWVAESLRHTHVYILHQNQQKLEVANPLKHFKDIQDQISPSLDDLYLYDEKAQKQNHLIDGAIDIVIKTHDRLDHSAELFPPYQMSYRLFDDKGRLIQKAENCVFENWLRRSSNQGDLPIYASMYDLMGSFEEASDQNWPSTLTTASVSQRYYRFILNHFKQNSKTNTCELLIEASETSLKSREIIITPETKWLKLKLKLQDQFGNQKTYEKFIFR